MYTGTLTIHNVHAQRTPWDQHCWSSFDREVSSSQRLITVEESHHLGQENLSCVILDVFRMLSLNNIIMKCPLLEVPLYLYLGHPYTN